MLLRRRTSFVFTQHIVRDPVQPFVVNDFSLYEFPCDTVDGDICACIRVHTSVRVEEQDQLPPDLLVIVSGCGCIGVKPCQKA
jgi:hypothetical protein